MVEHMLITSKHIFEMYLFGFAKRSAVSVEPWSPDHALQHSIVTADIKTFPFQFYE